MATIAGICQRLNPNIAFIDELTSLAQDLLGGEGRAKGLFGLLSQLKDMGEDAIPTLGQIPGLIERASSDKLVVRLLIVVRLSRTQVSALTNGQHSDTDRMTRAILGAALFVPDTLCRMTVGWSPQPIALFVKGLMPMVRQAHLARRKGRRGVGAILHCWGMATHRSPMRSTVTNLAALPHASGEGTGRSYVAHGTD